MGCIISNGMKHIETKNKTRQELQTEIKELQTKFMQLGFDRGDKKLKDSSQFNKIKKNIARLMTAYNTTK